MAGLNLREQAQSVTTEDLQAISERGEFLFIAQDIRNAIAERQESVEPSKYAAFRVGAGMYYLNARKLQALNDAFNEGSGANKELGTALDELKYAIPAPS